MCISLKKISSSNWSVALLLFFWALPSLAQVPSFNGLGDLPGGAVGSSALDISADGSVVVGESEGANGTESVSWTSLGGLSGLGFLSLTTPYSTATGISADATVITGISNDGNDVARAYRLSGGSMVALANQGCDSCDPLTYGRGISADGLVIVGSSAARSIGTAPLRLDAVRWPGGGTGLSDLGDLGGGFEVGEAFGASSDGSIISGAHDSADGRNAFYWNGSLNVLPTIVGGSPILASGLAVSDDGSTIVGFTNQSTTTLPGGTQVASNLQAVSWSGSGFATLTQLGVLPNSVSVDSSALAVSTDGSIIVGRALDTDQSDRAFIWDATHGLRNLKDLLESVYGLRLTGWVLSEASGISDVVDGSFSIVGSGINPQGEPEGWVAFLTTPACADGIDNDGDLLTDHPADLECLSPTDWSEENDCNDGFDNDADGSSDFPNEPDCLSASDPTELPDCSDGLDNDGDGLFDFSADPGCASVYSQREDPPCSDGSDNDNDLATDFPADGGCLSAADLSETPNCDDDIDNDADGLIDFPSDPECMDALDLSEAGQCADGIDNDGDGRVDFPEQFPGCTSAYDPIEAAQCSDGVDNDGDGPADFPADPDCASADGESENPVMLSGSELVVVDRASRAVFTVDTVTGAQTLISQGAFLQAPQGVAKFADRLIVADPVGLVEVLGTSSQRLLSAPLTQGESLQVITNDAAEMYVLEADRISLVNWNPSSAGVKSTYFQLPTPEVFPILELWHGDSFAFETSGDIVAGGLSLFGDSVFRIDQSTLLATVLSPGFDYVQWFDLAIEADGTILAVGFSFNVATGIYRIDPVTGVSTALNNTYGWQRPAAVAVDDAGEIWVADCGVCADGLCSGGEIVHVDPITGTATLLSSGGFISGELDLAVKPVPEPGTVWLLLSGGGALLLLSRARTNRRRANG